MFGDGYEAIVWQLLPPMGVIVRVAAYSSLVSDKRTCSLVNDEEASQQA